MFTGRIHYVGRSNELNSSHMKPVKRKENWQRGLASVLPLYGEERLLHPYQRRQPAQRLNRAQSIEVTVNDV